MSGWVEFGRMDLPTDAQVGTLIDARKGTPQGIASLDAGGRVPEEELPERLSPAALSTTIDGVVDERRGVPGGVAALDGAGRVPAAQLPTAAAGRAFIRPDIVTPGDSITAGQQFDPAEGVVLSWATVLSEITGRSVFNDSVPGERQGDVVTRAGVPLSFTVPGGTIPAGTDPFDVVLTSPTPAADHFIGSASAPQSYFEGTFRGVPVWARYDKTGWKMARLTPVTVAKPASATVPGTFRVTARGLQSALVISFGGRNGGTPSLISQTRRLLQNMQSPRRALLLPPLYRNLSHAADLQALANEFTDPADNVKVYDLRPYLAAHGLDDEGVPHTAQDDIDAANGNVPGSLFLDGTHPTAAGHRAIARRVAEMLVQYGMVAASTVVIPPRVVQPAATLLDLPTNTAEARMAAVPQVVRELTAGLSIEIECVFDALGGAQTVAQRNLDSGGGRAWHAYLINSDTLRFFYYPDGTNASAVQFNSAAGVGAVVGQRVWLRFDVDATNRRMRSYKSTDGVTWTEIGSGVNGTGGTGTTIAVSENPLRVGLFAGAVHNFRLRSFDRATTYIAEDWDSPLGSEWALLGGAALVSE